MVYLAMQKRLCILVCVMVCFSFICDVKANTTVKGTVSINGKRAIAVTDENFICATLDWWPSDKCDYGACSWGNSSLLNLDLKNVILLNAIKGALITFGLNALNGKTIRRNDSATGPWDTRNAASLIRYTVDKGYNVYGWELGNELGGRPIGVGVAPNVYASDTNALHTLIREIYEGANNNNNNSKNKPLILAPGGIFESDWFKRYIAKTKGVLDVITHHVYSLGSGVDEGLIDRIFNASVLDEGANDYKSLRNILKKSATSTVAWISEAGGVYNSGQDGVTNAFAFSFWYLDQLGIASVYDTKAYCRQSLVGGNYGLLNTTTFVPNPDYYSALLWHHLMGKYVLSTKFRGTKSVRAYAHCAKQTQGITILLINLDGNTTVKVKLDDDRLFGGKDREEYHLSPMDGNIQSRTVLLNGKALIVDSFGAIPAMEPVRVSFSRPINVRPRSIVFVHIPGVDTPACM
ncbi:hypothetical protein CASFOL_033034 [Castilleja foliolosa]|uniref:Heparanase-like protein 3 n=1 Tax=Castilleja foliolosa TaxID=1961234 RepID=A0ABD3C361_9LAMI